MGISLRELRRVLEHPQLQHRPLNLLDIGSQNLHGAGVQEIIDFVHLFTDSVDKAQLQDYANLLSQGAEVHPTLGGMNGAWAGDLIERVGIKYTAFDIFEGYGTTIFDLNEEDLYDPHRGAYDIVLNCGTTEHVLNQMNSFRVIHDATKVGGFIYNSLPMTGFLNHGYFNYNPLLFDELAQVNGYKIHRLTYNGPHGSEPMYDILVAAYGDRVPVDRADDLAREWADTKAPTASLSILMEKTTDAPFRASIEISTTVGSVVQSIGVASDQQSALAAIEKEEEALLERLDDTSLKPNDIFSVYQRRLAIAPNSAFPLQLEKRVLELFLKEDPTRDDLKKSLTAVEDRITARSPLLRFEAEAKAGATGTISVAMDGREEAALASAGTDEGFNAAVAAYQRYYSARRLDEFPAELERITLDAAIARRPDDPQLRVRKGQVLSGLIPKMPLAT